MVGERIDDVGQPHRRRIDRDLVEVAQHCPLTVVEAGDVEPRRARIGDPVDEFGAHRLQ